MSGIIAKLQELYEKEINFEISCFYDNAFEVRLGDPQNGYTWEGLGYYDLEVALKDLIKEVDEE